MAGFDLSEESFWLEEQCQGAPEILRQRAMHYLQGLEGPLPERLGRAARAALQSVIARAGDRSVALDLLAADGLVTLALKAQAARNPGELDRFAGDLLGD